MKSAWPFLLFLFACSPALADKRATFFADDVNRVNRKTGEPYFFFDAGEYERGLFFNVHSWFSTRKAEILDPLEPCLTPETYAEHAQTFETQIRHASRVPILEGCYHRFARSLIEQNPRGYVVAGIIWSSSAVLE